VGAMDFNVFTRDCTDFLTLTALVSSSGESYCVLCNSLEPALLKQTKTLIFFDNRWVR
jgi:hypothetical protein